MSRTPKSSKSSDKGQLKPAEINVIRKIVKDQILVPDNNPFRGSQKEFSDVLSLFRRAMEQGESNSALLIGPRGTGKSRLVQSVIKFLEEDCAAFDDSVIVRLNGYVHTDDRLALKGIATQLQLENTLGDRVFGSFAENLSFLLQCLKEGNREHSKSVIFILDEFDLFCQHQNQTLLYNLFDVAQSAQAPICVLGITCRKDVTDFLEKRVMSRFSNRQIHLYPHANETLEEGFKNRIQLSKDLLCLKSENKKHSQLSVKVQQTWNAHIESLYSNTSVTDCLKDMYACTVCERTLRNFLLLVICKLSEDHLELTPSDFSDVFKQMRRNLRVALVEGLSILELCVLISMMHQNEIFDSAPFNFEMVYSRLLKFDLHSSKTMTVDRQVVVKAFEHLKSLEFIRPVTTSSHVLKEFQMFNLMLLTDEIREAVNNYHGLPTEVSQWAFSDYT
ncbi:Origin recognition complex subunit 4 [Frankliniella fusca]|uniref:Origin recognition complex subunit 4 n=1 Tax=Frankliniella fusca TaxID=407009 RepID=A0AAE1LBA3_9NEOP|nr:Origin recognition complex subunit 4 [Frankliniella fusca]